MAETIEISKEIAEANPNWEQRLPELILTQGVRINYDIETDLFLMTFGESREGVMEPTSNAFVYLRLDPETLEIIGLAITAFQSKFLKHYKELQRPTNALFRQPAHKRWQFGPGSGQAEQTAGVVRRAMSLVHA